MLKWFVIAFIVALFFLVVLLGLGYLLQKNERETTVLKQQFDQQALIEKKQEYNKSRRLIINEPTSKQKSQQAILLAHKKCQDSTQCMLVQLGTEQCFNVVNTIGASILLKVANDGLQMKEASIFCQTIGPNEKALCKNSSCVIE
jgi:preprotein translocase subunit SecG